MNRGLLVPDMRKMKKPADCQGKRNQVGANLCGKKTNVKADHMHDIRDNARGGSCFCSPEGHVAAKNECLKNQDAAALG